MVINDHCHGSVVITVKSYLIGEQWSNDDDIDKLEIAHRYSVCNLDNEMIYLFQYSSFIPSGVIK